MRFRFDDFVLDLALGQLSRGDEEAPIEPRAFALLRHLIENSDRLVSKDELVETVWGGRFISDAAISTLVKTARRAIGDDGKAQRLIRTVHGRGFRFVGTLQASEPEPDREVSSAAVESAPPAEDPRPEGGPPCIAVLPFRRIGQSETYGAIADAVPSELISSLSRLRWLRVVARGSTFRFRDTTPDLTEIRSALGATYCLTGDVEIFGSDLTISVELSDTRDGRVVWGERMSGKIDDVHQIRVDIVGLVSSEMELHVSLNEADRARLRAPESLDAWSLYHLGLQRMYRFNRADNAVAAAHFARATALDPGFARAYAAQSFTSFQEAFVNYGGDRATATRDARRFAEKCVELDPLDPFGNFTLGRSLWLNGDHEGGQAWIEKSTSLSPSFSHAMYAHAFAEMIAGRGARASDDADKAIALSPLDPFLYAMTAVKGFSLLHLGDVEQASRYIDLGARQPGAHYLVTVLAAMAHRIAGDEGKARDWAERTLKLRPDASIAQVFAAYPLRDEGVRKTVHGALRALGFPER